MTFVRRHWLLLSFGTLGFLLVLLMLAALPLRSVPSDAQAAQDDLNRSVKALQDGDSVVAFAHVDSARGNVDKVTDSTEGIGAKVWSIVPGIGSGVRDVRHLATAMDELTSALEIAQDLYPQVSGDESTLLRRGAFNLGVLDTSLAGMDEISGHVRTAQSELDQVKGTAPLVGDSTANARNNAQAKVDPAVSALDKLDPLFGVLPGMLGADGNRDYVVALMNPAEMKFSGGSMLTFTKVNFESGELRRGRTRDTETTPGFYKQFTWDNVKGNPFASPYAERISHAGVTPSWPVAGEETLRAWEVLTKQDGDGLLAVDVEAMANLLRVTGPLQVEGLGEVTADNLVQLTAGEYARFDKDDQSRRKALNKALIPAFMKRIFSGVEFIDTLKALNESAQGRHLAFYLRDADGQAAMEDLGFSGALSDTEHDYVGFFTQNLVGSKADFFQQKQISSDVKVRKDGSARVTLKATVTNNGPDVEPGLLSDYTDPTLNIRLGAFLPQGVKVRKAELEAPTGVVPVDRTLGNYFGRPYLTHDVVIQAKEAATLTLVYDVPRAATVSGDKLTYHLDVDPHPTVISEKFRVTVHWPKGVTSTTLPKEWVTVPGRADRWETDALTSMQSWSVSAGR